MKSVKLLSLVLAVVLMLSFTACFNVRIVFPQAPEATQPTQANIPADTTLPQPADTTVPVTDATLPTDSAAESTTAAAPAESTTAAAPAESTTAAKKTPDQMSNDELLQFFKFKTLARLILARLDLGDRYERRPVAA